MQEWTKEQKETIIAFGDAIKDERKQFTDEGVDALDELIDVVIQQALASVSDLGEDQEGPVGEWLVTQMKEHTRRGLQRAIKGIAKNCEGVE